MTNQATNREPIETPEPPQARPDGRMTDEQYELYTEATERIGDSAIAWRRLLAVADLVGWPMLRDYLDHRAEAGESDAYLANYYSPAEIGELGIFMAKIEDARSAVPA